MSIVGYEVLDESVAYPWRKDWAMGDKCESGGAGVPGAHERSQERCPDVVAAALALIDWANGVVAERDRLAARVAKLEAERYGVCEMAFRAIALECSDATDAG